MEILGYVTILVVQIEIQDELERLSDLNLGSLLEEQDVFQGYIAVISKSCRAWVYTRTLCTGSIRRYQN